MERRTAGVTGIRLGGSLGGGNWGSTGRLWWVRTLEAVMVDEDVVAEDGMIAVL